VGVAEVAAYEAADPVEILHHDRLVEAELAFELELLGRVHHAGGVEQDVGDVAGHHAQQHEDDHRDPEQGQDHQQQPADQIAAHYSAFAPTTFLASCPRLSRASTSFSTQGVDGRDKPGHDVCGSYDRYMPNAAGPAYLSSQTSS